MDRRGGGYPEAMVADAEPHNLRILVADEREIHLEPIAAAVEQLGHRVIAKAVEGSEVGRCTRDHEADLAIVALHEDTAHALELIGDMVHEATCPVIVLVQGAQREFVAEAAAQGAFAHLDSTEEDELQGAIDIAVQRFRQYKQLLDAFDRRARIERAKGVLMERRSLGEDEAFETLRREARASRRQLLDIVDEILANG